MISGIYTAASGMWAQMLAQEVITDNLAKSQYPAYKRDVAVFEPFSRVLDRVQGETGQDLNGVLLSKVVTVFAGGKLIPTGNDLDIALKGDGFFTVETPQGIRYTRDGAFTLDSEGRLVTDQGFVVLGQGGPITISSEKGGKVSIGNTGKVILDGSTIGQLRISDFPKPYRLQKVGYGLFAPPAGVEGTTAADAEVAQGYLEMSNVDIFKEMVNLITVMRAYESGQKIIKAQDETLNKAINEVGRTR